MNTSSVVGEYQVAVREIEMDEERYISLEQSVVRVLTLLYCAGQPTAGAGLARRVESNVKLQKMDFLLRNPDYLVQMLHCDADEATAAGELDKAAACCSAATTVGASGEPELLAERMGKFLYGPFEHDYESIYGYAVARQLVVVRYVHQGAPGQREVCLTDKGLQRLEEEMFPNLTELRWYQDHASIIGTFYGEIEGFRLERLLYERFPWIGAVPNEMLIGPYEESYDRWFSRR